MIQNEELLLALNTLDTIIVITDINGSIQYVNDGFVKKYGYTQEEAIGANPRILKTDFHDEYFYKDLWDTILSGNIWEGIFLNKDKYNKQIWEKARITPIFKGNKINGFIAVKSDITDRKELEERIFREKFLLNNIFENAPIGVITFKGKINDKKNIDLIATKANKEAYKLLEFDRIIGSSIDMYMSGVIDMSEKLLHSRQKFPYYLKSYKKHFNIETYPLDSFSFCMFIYNVTDYNKQIEEKNNENTNLSSFFYEMPKYIVRYDPDFVIKEANEEVFKLLDLPSSEVIGKNIFDLVTNFSDKSIYDMFKILKNKNSFREDFQNMTIKNNQNFYFKWKSKGIYNKKGKLIEVVSEGIDLSKINNINLLLEKNEYRLCSIFENNIWGICVINEDGDVLYANSTIKTIFRYNQEQKSNKLYYFDFIHKDIRKNIKNNYLKLIKSNKSNFILEHEFINCNGSPFWGIVYASVIKESNSKEKKIMLLIADSTDRHSIEKELKENSEHLRVLNETKDKLLSMIAHDIKNSLNIILGFANLLETGVEDYMKSEIQDFASKISEMGEQTYKLLEDLLVWAKSQLGQIDLSFKSCNIKSIVNECIISNNAIANSKEIKVINNIAEDINILVDIDSIKFVIRNIIHNALKFSYRNNIVECGTDIIGTKNNKMVNIYIQDYGIGISKENIDKIFDLSQMFSTEGTNLEKGSGMGLTLCKDIITKNNGKITIKSKEGFGSRFIISLPLA